MQQISLSIISLHKIIKKKSQNNDQTSRKFLKKEIWKFLYYACVWVNCYAYDRRIIERKNK